MHTSTKVQYTRPKENQGWKIHENLLVNKTVGGWSQAKMTEESQICQLISEQ